MKQPAYLLMCLLFMVIRLNVFGHTGDTINPTMASTYSDSLITKTTPADKDETDDFSSGMFFFAIIGFAFILVSVGAGIALTVLGLLIVFGLVSAGVLSTSIIVGLNKKSFAKGFKTFLMLGSTIGGLVLGGLGFWLFNMIVHWCSTQTAILTGATCGLIVGGLFGLLTYYILRRLTNYFKERLRLPVN